MAATSLVREQIEGGEKLIRKLFERGVGVEAALWCQREYDSQSYFYLVLPQHDANGPINGFREIGAAQAELESEGIHWMEQIERFSVKLIPPTDPLAQGVLKRYHDFPALKPSLPRDQRIGSEFVEGAFIYPPSLFQPVPAATP